MTQRWRASRSLAVVALALLLASADPLHSAARAQQAMPSKPAPAAASSSQPQSPTLASALAAAQPSPGEIYIAVDAASVKLPPGALPIAPGEYVNKTAYAYNRLVQPYDAVVAIAPPTMVVLNTDLGTPNPFAGMPPNDAFKLLLGTLSDSQWTALTSADGPGLGYSDMTGDDQKALWDALFPADPVQLNYPQDLDGNTLDKTRRDPLPYFSDTLALQAHLRAGKQVIMFVDSDNDHAWVWASKMEDQGDAGGSEADIRYALVGSDTTHTEQIYGKQIRAEVLNQPKPSDLDYEAAVLSTSIDPAGATTVDALVARIAAAARLELYADPAYGKLPVTLVGTGAVPAGDLLRAIALCVCGTYRKVGPAYVLTDDLAGVAVRRARITHFIEMAGAMRSTAESDAEDNIFGVHHGLDQAAFLSSALALTPGEQAMMKKRIAGDPLYYPGASTSIYPTYAQLSPDQQQAVDQAIAQAKSVTGYHGTLSRNSKIRIRSVPLLILTAPGIDGTVDADVYYLSTDSLMFASERFTDALKKKKHDADAARALLHPQPASAPAPTPKRATLAALEAPFGQRAALVRAATPGDVDRLFASARLAGITQIWLDVFSQGEWHIPADTDILAAAIRAGTADHIRVVAAISLLNWQFNAAPQAEDLTLLGLTIGAEMARENELQRIAYADDMESASIADESALAGNYLSPASPSALSSLRGIIRRLSNTPGLSGIALRDTIYDDYQALGYSPDMRLAFLRKFHSDPIDLDYLEFTAGQNDPNLAEFLTSVDTSLPYFPGTFVPGGSTTDWDTFRLKQNHALLEALFGQTVSDNGRQMPMWIHNRLMTNDVAWYSVWDGKATHLPDEPLAVYQQGFSAGYNYAEFARTLSPASLVTIDGASASTADGLADAVSQIKPGWSGFLIDYLSTTSDDPVAQLVPRH